MSSLVNLELVEELLKLPSAILIGSRALSTAHEYSDYDIAIFEGDLPDDLDGLSEVDVRRYFQALPMGNTRLYKTEGIDLIVYDKLEHVHAVGKAMGDLRKVPSYMLAEKDIRIELFILALVNQGFERHYD
jgi:hypothetical protein